MASPAADYLVHRVIKNAPYRHSWVFRDANGNVQASVASIVEYVAKDTCNPVDAANPTAVQAGTPASTLYYLDLTAAEMAANRIEVFVTGSNVNSEYAILTPEPALDSGQVTNDAGAASTIELATTALAVPDIYNGATIEIVRGTGAGQVRTVVDYSAARTLTVDRPWATQPIRDMDIENNWSVYLIHPRTGTPTTNLSSTLGTQADVQAIDGDAAAATMLQLLYTGAFIAGAINDAAPTTTSFTGSSGFSTTADFYNDMFLVFTSGTLKGIPRQITDYSATRVFTTDAFPVAPANNDTFIVIAHVE